MNAPNLRQLVYFYLLAVTITVLVMAAVFISGSMSMMDDLFSYLQETVQYPNVVSIGLFGLLQNPWALLILLFAGAPTLAAILVCAFAGRGQLRLLLSRYKPVGPDAGTEHAATVYAALFGIYALVLCLYIAVALATGTSEASTRMLQSLGGSVILIVIWSAIAPFLDEGGLLEELGWRGFAWQGLQARLASPLMAALVLGFLWWAWHLPRELPGLLGGAELLPFLKLQGLFLLLCIAETIVCGLAVNMTGGSVLPAILIHGGSNVWSKAAGAPMYAATGNIDVRTVIMVIAAVLILWRFGPRLGRSIRVDA